MKVNKLFTLAVTLLLSTVTVVSCGNNTPTSSSPSTSASSQAVESSSSASSASSSAVSSSQSSSAVSSSESSSAAPSSSSSAEVINYGTEDAPLTIAEAKALCDKLGENTISTAPLFVKGYVVEITFDTKYSNYEIWLSTTSTGEKEFELYACTIKDGVNTPIVGSQVIATGYYEKYVKDTTTTYELTHTKVGETRVYPNVIWSDAEAPAPTPEVEVIGTLDAPKTVIEGLEVIAALGGTSNTQNYSEAKYYVKAVVTSTSSDNDVYTMTVADTTDLSKTLIIYQATLGENVTGPSVGDEVVILGHLANYYGKNQMSGKGDEYVAPVIAKTTANTSTYTVTTSIVDAEGEVSTNATVTGLPTESVAIGTMLSFTVAADEGYKVTSVTFNGAPLSAEEDGSYKVASYLENKITVTVVQDIAYEDTTVEYSIATIAADNEWKDGSKYTTLPTGKEELSITTTSGTSNGYYSSGYNQWRIYQSDKATLNINVSGSHTIKSVTLTYATNNNGVAVYNDQQYATDVEIKISSQSLVSISVGQTKENGKSNGQVRITKIKVIYA